MRTLRMLSAGLALGMLLSGCSKDDNTTNPPTPPDPVSTKFSYTIEGIADASLKQAGTVNMPITIKPVAGTSETVTLVATGVPENVQIGITPPSGEPSFATTVTIVATLDAKAGTYPVKIVGTSKSGVVVEKAFNLTVRNQNCAQDFQTGTWNGTRTCKMLTGASFQSTITPDQYLKEITISNFGNYGKDAVMSCSLDCDKGTLSIREKSFSAGAAYSYSLAGDGTFTQNELRIRMFYADSGRNKDTCTLVYTR
jgi:hypothetical protein